ncbi:MAG: 23S rRNA (guanosine(2251)-2'-O)-methyltransferase RlmB [Actinobacteria bacterium]|nr:MAG: 23S rRNA (guanosine(2251)-2'-O)-methyltransferase RlmB [Actinomycetota bacterium]
MLGRGPAPAPVSPARTPRDRPRGHRPRPPGSRQPGSRRGSDRGDLGGEQVEGRRAVRELLAAGRRRAREVWVAEGVDPSPLLEEIAFLAHERRVPLRHVPRARLEAAARTEAPQGVLAHAEALPDVDLDELCRPGPDGGAPFLLVFDGVTDPHNLGALLRSGVAAGATGAILPRHRAAHVTPGVAKAAAGAIEHIAMAVVAGVPSALRSLAGHGVWTVGLDPGAPSSLFELTLADQAVALVLGAEGSGLSKLTRQRCEVLVAVPMRGAVASLNVAAAGAVACFEVARRRS